MADETVSFAYDIDPSGAQAGASASADAIDALTTSLDEGQTALSEMNKAMRLLKGGTSTDVAAFKELRDAITAKKATLSQLTAELVKSGVVGEQGVKRNREALSQQKADAAAIKEREKLAKAENDSKKKAAAEREKIQAKERKEQKEALDAVKAQNQAMAQSISQLGGPLSGLLGQFQGLSTVVGSGLLAAGALAIAAAFIALAAGVAVAISAFVKYGIVAADARRNEELQLEGLTKMRNWYGLAAGKATDLQGAIDGVSAKVALSRPEIEGMTEGLYRANLRGEALKQGLEAVALATSAGGAAQGAFYQNMVVSAARSGVKVQRILDDARARYGELSARKMLSLDVQAAKARENLDGLFRNVKIEGFLKALNEVTSMLSQATIEGRALQQIVTIVLNPLIGGLTTAGPLAKRFFQGMILEGQEVVISVLTLALVFKNTFGSVLPKNIDLTTKAVDAGKVAVFLLLAAVTGVAIATAVLFAAAATPILALALAFGAPVYAAYRMVKALRAAFENLGPIGREVASDLVLGIVNGLTLGIPRVVAAVAGLGTAAKEALKKVWDSHSPSRVFEVEGGNAARGSVVGIRRGIPKVEAAAADLGHAATISYTKGGEGEPDFAPTLPRRDDKRPPPPAAGAAAHNTFHFEIHANSEEGGRAAMKGARAELTNILQGVAIGIGAAKVA